MPGAHAPGGPRLCGLRLRGTRRRTWGTQLRGTRCHRRGRAEAVPVSLLDRGVEEVRDTLRKGGHMAALVP